MKEVQLIDHDLFSATLAQAEQSPRKRANFNFHQYRETYQRFLNVLNYGSYVCPHKHTSPPKAETFLILRGELAFFIFDESGQPQQIHRLSENGPVYGLDIQPDVWHCLLCLSEQAVCFEGKTGPYDPNEDKIFADWAPQEGQEGVEKYQKYLLSLLKE